MGQSIARACESMMVWRSDCCEPRWGNQFRCDSQFRWANQLRCDSQFQLTKGRIFLPLARNRTNARKTLGPVVKRFTGTGLVTIERRPTYSNSYATPRHSPNVAF